MKTRRAGRTGTPLSSSPFRVPDPKKDREQIVKISKQNLQESLEEPGIDNLADLAKTLKKIRGKKK
jgi:hypothetical protein